MRVALIDQGVWTGKPRVNSLKSGGLAQLIRARDLSMEHVMIVEHVAIRSGGRGLSSPLTAHRFVNTFIFLLLSFNYANFCRMLEHTIRHTKFSCIIINTNDC